MQLKFTKMHGAGNDFVVIDLISQRYKLRSGDIRKLADRRLGIGCDQVLVVEAPRRPDVDFRYRIYNADGTEVEQCGNGARCFARFVREQKLTHKRRFSAETAAGTIVLQCLDKQCVEVDMGPAELEPERIPLLAPARTDSYHLALASEHLEIGAVSMGNPHAILRVTDIDTADISGLGPLIGNHPHFPEGVNIGFMQLISAQKIRLRVVERGAGETLACGTGACAAVVYGRLRGWLQDTVTVQLPGGMLSVTWRGPGHSVMMSGPTAVVFEGTIKI